MKKTVVAIVCLDGLPDGGWIPRVFNGTGFFITSEGRFLTAAHVIDSFSTVQPPCGAEAILIPQHGWDRDAASIPFTWVRIGACIKDGTLDIATCIPQQMQTGLATVNIADGRPPDGTKVAFTGFPLNTAQPFTSRCDIAQYQSATDGEGSRMLVLDKWAWPGDSGSPVYTETGEVIGIVLRRGLGDGEGIGFALSSPFIVKFLRANGLWEEKPKAEEPKAEERKHKHRQ